MTRPGRTLTFADVEPDRRHSRSADNLAALGGENRGMSLSAPRPAGLHVGRMLRAPFSRRTWVNLRYSIISVPVAVAGFACTVLSFSHPLLVFVSTPLARGLGTVNRGLAARLLGEHVPAPPPMRIDPHVHARTPETARLSGLIISSGGLVKMRRGRLVVTRLPAARVAELAASENITLTELKTHKEWLGAAAKDKPGWRARAYLVLKLPVSLLAPLTWAAALTGLLAPLWLHPDHPVTNVGRLMAVYFVLMLLGAAVLLAAPRLTEAAVGMDRALIRGLLGPTSLAERVRDLEETRAHAVDDSAARLRSIERDLHDGAQAQLVGLAMKLGLAKEKLGGGTDSGTTAGDLDRALELVDAAHRSAIEAIAELRVLARGIHPPVLDNGLADALATLAARSAVPVELIVDIKDRPSAAIETIAYFCAGELLANAAKHSGARHAILEAVHVPGLVRVRVTDDGRGGASMDAGGGLRGLAERISTVDGRMEMTSPAGGPTVVTVELPSRA
jgi:signal transduction histidine kinase